MSETGKRLLNLNAARERELTQLPRVGVDLARRIVHHRAIRKGFRDWEDLARSTGIGEEDLEAIRARAWIGPVEVQQMPSDRRRTRRGQAMLRRPKPLVP